MSFSENYRQQVIQTLQGLELEKVEQAIQVFKDALASDRHIFVCGNGGSASTASHFVCDIVKGASYQRDSRFRIMALTDNMATITAYSNDVGYDCVFEEQLKNFAQPGDVLLALSGSGNSPNVVNAMKYAREKGLKTIALTGRDGGKLGPLAELNIQASVPHMGRIEDAHMVVCHMIGYYFMEGGCATKAE